MINSFYTDQDSGCKIKEEMRKRKQGRRKKSNIRVKSDLSELKYLEMMHIKCNKFSFKYLHIHR